MLITHRTTQCIIVERVHRTKVFRVWTRSRCILYKTVYRRQMLSEVILVISRSNYGFAFVRFLLISYMITNRMGLFLVLLPLSIVHVIRIPPLQIMSGTGVEKLQTILMAQVSTIEFFQ